MKKTVLTLIVIAAFLLAYAAMSHAAGSCTQTVTNYYRGGAVLVSMACTGDSGDGSIPNTAIAAATTTLLTGTYYLYSITARPTSGGTAPDAADVFILNANGEDLLGSTDGGTTANKGANLLHATLTKTTLPYSHYLSMHYFPVVTGSLTLKVSNQATHSANYTIDLLFVK